MSGGYHTRWFGCPVVLWMTVALRPDGSLDSTIVLKQQGWAYWRYQCLLLGAK